MFGKEFKLLKVELICKNNRAPNGIGRYARELHKHLAPHVSVRRAEHIYPRLASRIDPLRYFPIGIRDHQAGNIVHFMEDFGCSQMLWRPIRPAVATSHDLGFLAWPPEAQMHRTLDRILLYLSYLGLKCMDAVITISDYSRQTLIRHLGIAPGRIFTVHSGNDPDQFRPVANARAKLATRYGFPEDERRKLLLYVGTEFPRKNLASLLRALKMLPSNVYLLKVGHAGGQRFRAQTRSLIASLELEDRICLFDQIPERDLSLFYSAADAYVCASFLEGFGHPVLEAMSCGTPVVCSNTASLPEIAGDAALQVPPDDLHALVEAVHSVLFEKLLREEMILRGRKRAASFSWTHTASKVAEVYRLLVENNYG